MTVVNNSTIDKYKCGKLREDGKGESCTTYHLGHRTSNKELEKRNLPK